MKGILTADSPSAARLKLSQDQIFPTSVNEIREVVKDSSSGGLLSRVVSFKRINPVEVTTALRHLATLVSAGLPLVQCLTGLIEQTEQTSLKRIFIQIKERVVEGASLHQAIAAHPSVFGRIDVHMIRAGETGGALDVILKRLADLSETRLKLKKRIEAAMAYPLFLIFISSVILIFLMSFVMPKVISVFEGMALALPWTTRALIWITHFMKRFWWLVGFSIIAVFGIAVAWVKTDRGRRTWDILRLHAPLLGKLHLKAVIARFTRTLSILLKSGIPLVSAMEISRHAMGNSVMEETIKETTKLVAEGDDFASTLSRMGGFPPLIVQLIRAGEQSGELEEMLSKAAEIYEEDVKTAINSVMSVVEPVIILIMGLVVGFLVMAILLPIFDMTGGIK
ncbi:type II secretion system F family protein [Thermodesulfobacteriota bacterium]